MRAIPTAMPNRSRYLLLVFSDSRSPEERVTAAAKAQENADREAAQQETKPSEATEAPATESASPAPATPAEAEDRP